MNNVDINKIVDDAMEKKDRQVHIFIVGDTVSVNVTPLSDSDPRWIKIKNIESEYTRNGYECSECRTHVDFMSPYCPVCGEKLRFICKEDSKGEPAEKRCGDCDSCDNTDCQNTPDEEVTDE